MRFSLRQFALVTLIILAIPSFGNAQLSGNYTINAAAAASATNYQNFTSAVGDMVSGVRTDGGAANGPAINGAVTFTVSAGTYSEQISIPQITGSSATNTITFDGVDPATRTITRTSTSSGDYTIRLNGGDYVRFYNLGIENLGTTYGFPVQLLNNSNNCEVIGCEIDMPTTTTGSSKVGIIGGTSISNYFLHCNDLTIQNNTITGGTYSIAISGPTNTQCQGLTIENNDLMEAYNTGIRLNYVNQPQILSNNIDLRNVYTFAYGIYLRYCSEFEISNNVVTDPGGYGIYMFQNNFNTNNTSLIYNNMIGGNYRATGTAYGLYMSSCRYTNIYHNSILLDNPGTSARGIYVTSSASTNIDIRNNSFATDNTSGTAYALYFVNANYVSICDYNNYYCAGPNLGRIGSVNCANLAALQAAGPGLNLNSQEGWPNYTSVSDLHTFGPPLSNWATNIPSINTDIDGDSRPLPPDPTKDVGADEFVLPPFDLDIWSIVSPSVLGIGNNPVTIELQNNGTNSLNGQNITLQYSTDGGLSWPVTEVFTPTNLANPGDQENYTFAAQWNVATAGNYNLCVRVNPQVIGDPDPADEICISVCTGMGGAYTINSALPTGGTNYQSFTDAAAALSGCGIVAPVTFTVAPGVYNESFTIGQVLGTSATNTVIFEGQAAAQCTLSQNFTTTNQAIVRLNGTDHTTFRNITIESTGTSGYGIQLMGEADYNEIHDCIFNMPLTTTSAYNIAIVMAENFYYTYGNTGNYNYIHDNVIRGGYYGIRANGISTSSYVIGNRFENNDIADFYYYGFYGRYLEDVELLNNSFVGRNGGSTGSYGMYLYYGEGDFRIEDNVVRNVGSRGLYFFYGNYTNQGRGSIINNMFGGGFFTSGTTYGMYLYNLKDTDILHNSVNIGGQNGNAVYIGGSSGQVDSLRVMNNIFAADGYISGGPAMNVTSSAAPGIQMLDYNLYWSSGPTMALYGGFSLTNLTQFQSSYPAFNQNSVEDTPGFISETNLHIVCSPIDNLGTYVGVDFDIDDENRSQTTPDIGADEFTSINITYDIGPDTSNCEQLTLWADTTNFVGFQWGGGQSSASLNVDTTGMYSVTVIDSNNCRATDSLFVTIYDNPVLPFNNDTISQCSYDTVDAMNPGATYVWSTNETSQTIVPPASGTYTVDITSPDGCTLTDQITITLFADAVANLGPDTTFCQGGSATLDAGSGPTGTTYQWSNGSSTQVIVISAANTYTVTVTTPQGCVATDDVVMNAVQAPVVELGSDRIECDQFTLDATSPNATYSWSNGPTTPSITSTLSGTYTVTVTDPNGCATIDQVVITVETSPVPNLGPAQILCENDVVVLDAGFPGYNHEWNTSATTQTITVSSPGTYFATVTDPNTGCDGFSSVVVNQSFLTVDLGPDFTLCDGSSAVLDAGSGPTGYLWQNGTTSQMFTVNGPGLYSVQVTDGTCIVDDSLTVTSAPLPAVSFASTNNIPMLQGVQFTDGSAGSVTSWLWDFGDGNTSTQQNPVHSYQAMGTFNVCLTVTDGQCENTTCNNVTITAPVGVEDELFANSVLVYPNPTSGEFHIDFDLPKTLDLEIVVYSLTGQALVERSLSGVRAHNEMIDLGAQAAGMYFLKVTSNKGNEMIRKVIVE